ncbi:MAG TPA: hypothetical protein DCP53_07115 [Elusimicrobia bacterium]|nr:hypothetical protein [Elusimicrobiota bacterium]
MKIILLFPKWTLDYGIFAHFAKKASTWPPLNLAYLAALAEKMGHEVKIIDGQVEDISLEKMINQVLDFKPDIIGITATTPFFHLACKLAKGIKKTNDNTPIVIGGPHVTVLREEAFEPCFDYAFIGEADDSWPKFLKEYESGGNIHNVKGILLRDKDGIKFTGPAQTIDDLDSLPLPSRHLLKMNKYKLGTLKGNLNFATIIPTRGCPYKCIFCNTKIMGNRVRKRLPESVVSEIKSVKECFNIKHFVLLADNLTLDRAYILKICDLIEKENLNITFEGGTRANLVDDELIAKLVRAGMIRLGFGLESADENIRQIIRKEVPLKYYDEANRLTNKYGVETLSSCMIGLPGETVETVCKTLAFLRNSREIKQANISIAIPYPGTELYEMAKNEKHGLKIVYNDFSKFLRYNCAVMQVGNLSPNDLILIQNDAFVSIYFAPWRWLPMIKKSGIGSIFLMFSRLIKSIFKGKINFITNKPRKKR